MTFFHKDHGCTSASADREPPSQVPFQFDHKTVTYYGYILYVSSFDRGSKFSQLPWVVQGGGRLFWRSSELGDPAVSLDCALSLCELSMR